ncbi:MAG: biotin--[Clostridia bacterium]|nr:biotin--[acetyl-CoA-carboxylase] ligase [Clostridia bacterium]
MMQQGYGDPLTREALLSYLEDGEALPRVYVYDTLDSTNTAAKALAVEVGEDTDPCLIVAHGQTAGRGRMGRSFYSPPESGVYFSILLPSVSCLPDAVSVTCAASVAVMRALRRLSGKQTAIKWVNDLYYNQKKVCGILCEGMTQAGRQSLIVGIGINLRPAAFPEEIREIAGSMEDGQTPRAALIAAVYTELLPYLLHPTDRSWLTDYRTCSMVLGRQVRWMRDGVWQEGKAYAIDEDGALLVSDAHGDSHRLCTGEISVRLTP